jgi:hypothetical protein
MVTVLEECATENQFFYAFFFVRKRTHCKGFSKGMIPVYGGKGFVMQSGLQLGGKRLADDEEVETEVRKWLRQQSKDFYAEGFDPLVKRRDKCVNVGGGYVQKWMFFPASNITCFTFYIHL